MVSRSIIMAVLLAYPALGQVAVRIASTTNGTPANAPYVVDLRAPMTNTAWTSCVLWVTGNHDPSNAALAAWRVFNFAGNSIAVTQSVAASRPQWWTNALSFDGSDDQCILPDMDALSSTGMTLAAYFYPRAIASDKGLYTKEATGNFEFRLFFEGNSLVRFNRFNPGGTPILNVQTTTGSILSNTWQHVTMACDATSAAMYVSGVLNTAVTFGAIAPSNGTAQARLGNDPSVAARFGNFILGEFAQFNRRLTGEEIADLNTTMRRP